MLAFAVGAAFDWFWEIAALGAVFFLAAGVARRRPAAASSPPTRAGKRARKAEERRFGLAVGGLALAWIAAVALVGPLLVEREIDSSQAAAARADFGTAVDHADTARSIEPWAASPYVQLGLLAERQGELPGRRSSTSPTRSTARTATGSWYYLRSRVEHEAGETRRRPGPTSTSARQLNPRGRSACAEEWTCG